MPELLISNYDKTPRIDVSSAAGDCVSGWSRIEDRLRKDVVNSGSARTVMVVECYPGVNVSELSQMLKAGLSPSCVYHVAEAMLSPVEVGRLTAPFAGGEDPVFGYVTDLAMPDFFNEQRLSEMRAEIETIHAGLVLLIGCGARLIHPGDILIYADLARWEAQLRFRRDESSNLGMENHSTPAALQYKHAFFIDWRVADRWKASMIQNWDYLLDSHRAESPKLVTGEALRFGLRQAVRRPFRVVPFFDPAPWGGQWMRESFDLDAGSRNFGWCFDCVPEENSLLLGFDGELVEIPSLDVVLSHPQDLLGEAVHAMFGAEFPIRFDLLDTMGGGNLSFQVHPLVDYIKEHFGMSYTQDESYYIIDAEDDGFVYLGLKEDVDPEAMISDLIEAEAGGAEFPVDRHACRWPARKHDHFLIPAGTVHCSGANSMVLEISATPYIFTFKMWDWGRLGLDGKPRHVHMEHGLANIQWDRREQWVRNELINALEPVASGDEWREESTGLHSSEFIETRRHWFTGKVHHHTLGGVNVLNLVQGREAIVESPDGAFEPFVIHFAETFIVPAAVGDYTIRPHGDAIGTECATLKASVRI